MAMTYGYVYVAQVCLGADMNQTVKAIAEAESYNGPSLIIAYSPCINHGIISGMGDTPGEQKKAVACGYWQLYRYNPDLVGQKPAFSLDSKAPNYDLFNDFLMREVRYSALAKVYPELAEELFARIHVGDVVEGTVKNVTDFGAFIDLGGVDGLLHISEMSWGRVENPKKVFKVGDELKVLIKDIHDTKIALSLKFPETNPWANAAEDYAVGTVITGKVARMTDFGAFVELAPGVDALLHVSQISRAHVEKPSDVLSVGQEITAKIVDLNEADKKISLSMKALENTEAQEETEE